MFTSWAEIQNLCEVSESVLHIARHDYDMMSDSMTYQFTTKTVTIVLRIARHNQLHHLCEVSARFLGNPDEAPILYRWRKSGQQGFRLLTSHAARKLCGSELLLLSMLVR